MLDRVLPHPPQLARWGFLPHAMPLAAQATSTLPHIVVVVDRTGADIEAYGRRSEHVTEREGKGSRTFPIHKADQGGWSQARYQRRAENVWEHNAKEVAEGGRRLVVAYNAQLLIVAGDVRARVALREHLAKRSLGVLAEIEEGGRAAGVSEGATHEAMHEAIERTVAEAAAADRRSVVEKYEEERGQHDRAAEGLRATIEALWKTRSPSSSSSTIRHPTLSCGWA